MREGTPRWKKRRAPANRATAQALSHPHHKGVGDAGRKRERSVSERGVFGEVGGSASKEAAVVVISARRLGSEMVVLCTDGPRNQVSDGVTEPTVAGQDGEHSGERCRCWSASRDPDPCWVTHRKRGGRLAPATTNLGRGTSRRGGGYTPSPEIRLSCRDQSRRRTRCPDRVLLRRERGP